MTQFVTLGLERAVLNTSMKTWRSFMAQEGPGIYMSRIAISENFSTSDPLQDSGIWHPGISTTLLHTLHLAAWPDLSGFMGSTFDLHEQ